jgi:hypothetical protein
VNIIHLAQTIFVMGSCSHDNEIWTPMKDGEFLKYLSVYELHGITGVYGNASYIFK